MEIIKKNDTGETLYIVNVELKKIDLSEYSGEEGDYGEMWVVTSGKMPTKSKEENEALNKQIEALLNAGGENIIDPIPKEQVESVVLKIVDDFIKKLL